MSRREKFFLTWIIITLPLAMLLTIVGGIVCIFNSFVGQIIFFIGLGIALFVVIIPYIIWCIGGMIKLMKEEE
jgi:hypothetical protein